jgi:hypothetical protein
MVCILLSERVAFLGKWDDRRLVEDIGHLRPGDRR